VKAVLFGDSHAQQWLPVMQTMARENNWQLNQFTKAACPVAALQPRDGRTDPFTKSDCLGWREDSIKAIIALKPKYIVIGSLSTYVPDYQEFKTAWDQSLNQLRETGAKLIYLRDTPYPNKNIPECVSGATDDWSKCDFDLNNVHRTEPIVTDQVRGENLDIPVLDVNAYLCETNNCRAVRNGTMPYRDDSHLKPQAERNDQHRNQPDHRGDENKGKDRVEQIFKLLKPAHRHPYADSYDQSQKQTHQESRDT
jgi:hypothetical protein